jgi:hypothetical protein
MRPSRDSDTEIARAVEGLYATFGGYPAPPEPELSPLKAHLIDHARALHRARLAEIQAEALWPYAFHALTTWGGEDELKHFIPRLLELLWREPHWADATQLVGKLGYARWRDWPEPEQRAIERFFDAWFLALLDDDRTIGLAGDLLCGIARCEESIASWLDRWGHSDSHTATLQLADLIDRERGSLYKRGQVSRDWLEPARSELSRWLRSPETADRLEAAYLRAPTAPAADRIAAAFDILSCLPPEKFGGA